MHPKLRETALVSDSEISVGLKKTYYTAIIHHLLPLNDIKKRHWKPVIFKIVLDGNT